MHILLVHVHKILTINVCALVHARGPEPAIPRRLGGQAIHLGDLHVPQPLHGRAVVHARRPGPAVPRRLAEGDVVRLGDLRVPGPLPQYILPLSIVSSSRSSSTVSTQ